MRAFGGTHAQAPGGRPEALPEGIYPADIRALAATPDGGYVGVTSSVWLSYSEGRFEAHPVPAGFAPTRLLAQTPADFWALGPHRAWRFVEGHFHVVPLPMAHIHADWLAPDGALWVAGADRLHDEFMPPRDEFSSEELGARVLKIPPRGAGARP